MWHWVIAQQGESPQIPNGGDINTPHHNTLITVPEESFWKEGRQTSSLDQPDSTMQSVCRRWWYSWVGESPADTHPSAEHVARVRPTGVTERARIIRAKRTTSIALSARSCHRSQTVNRPTQASPRNPLYLTLQGTWKHTTIVNTFDFLNIEYST